MYNARAIQPLLDGGAEVNAENLSGWTPLHSASVHNNTRAIQPLLDGGAKVNAEGHNGWTPLHFIASKSFYSSYNRNNIAQLLNRNNIAQLLVAAGADINAINNKGQKPLDLVPTYWDTCDPFGLFTSECRNKLGKNKKLREILNPNSDLDLDMESSP